MYEHKLNDHREVPDDFNPDNTTAKDFIINMLAEQSMETMEEVVSLKKDLKKALEAIESGKQEAKGLNLRISALEKGAQKKKKGDGTPAPGAPAHSSPT